MKNKILAAILILAVLSPGIYAKDRDQTKLITGIILSAAGALVAYSGFHMPEISLPEMSMQSFTTVTAGTGPWDISASGTVKNTGNLPLENIKITVIYKDNMGAEISSQEVNLASKSAFLSAGDTDTFSSSLTGLGTEPAFFSARFYADYNELFISDNVTTGIVGSVIVAAGIFFICDYIFDITDFFEQNDVKVQLSAINSGMNIMTTRSF